MTEQGEDDYMERIDARTFDMPKDNPDALRFKLKKYGPLAALRTRARASLIALRWAYLVKGWGMDIHRDTLISLQATLDKTYPKGIHIGAGTAVSFGAAILSHDYIRGLHCDTRIGRFCQIGARSFIMPGLTIGDHCIIGAGAVVTKDVPAGSVVVGNPGRIIRSGIMTEHWGKLAEPGQPINK